MPRHRLSDAFFGDSLQRDFSLPPPRTRSPQGTGEQRDFLQKLLQILKTARSVPESLVGRVPKGETPSPTDFTLASQAPIEGPVQGFLEQIKNFAQQSARGRVGEFQAREEKSARDVINELRRAQASSAIALGAKRDVQRGRIEGLTDPATLRVRLEAIQTEEQRQQFLKEMDLNERKLQQAIKESDDTNEILRLQEEGRELRSIRQIAAQKRGQDLTARTAREGQELQRDLGTRRLDIDQQRADSLDKLREAQTQQDFISIGKDIIAIGESLGKKLAPGRVGKIVEKALPADEVTEQLRGGLGEALERGLPTPENVLTREEIRQAFRSNTGRDPSPEELESQIERARQSGFEVR